MAANIAAGWRRSRGAWAGCHSNAGLGVEPISMGKSMVKSYEIYINILWDHGVERTLNSFRDTNRIQKRYIRLYKYLRDVTHVSNSLTHDFSKSSCAWQNELVRNQQEYIDYAWTNAVSYKSTIASYIWQIVIPSPSYMFDTARMACETIRYKRFLMWYLMSGERLFMGYHGYT